MEQDMKYIYQIYLDGSFSAAADHLYMSQPALSIAVRRVEDMIGAEIFDRSRRPLALTEAGKAYIDTLESIRRKEEDLARQIEDLRGLKTGTLRLGGTHYLNCYILASILTGFSETYPGIRLELREDSSAELNKALEKHELDLILSCAPEVIEQYEHQEAFYDHILLAVHEDTELPDQLRQYSLTAEQVLSGSHLDPGCPSAGLAAFKDLEFILLQKGNNLYGRSRQMFAEAGITPRIKMTISQMVTSYRFADNGFGAAFISDRLVRSPRSHLRFFKLRSQHTDRLFCFVQPHRDYTPFAVRGFIEYASKHIPNPVF